MISTIRKIFGLSNVAGAHINPATEDKQDDIKISVDKIHGTGATDLGKAEDAAHTSGDTGIMGLTVRKDTPAALSGTDGDYQPTITDKNGLTHVLDRDFLTQVSLGNVPGFSLVHKFGASELDTTIHPLTQSKTYETPTANTALEFVSDNANDSSSGTGAQEITIEGLTNISGVWTEVTQTLATNGTTSVALTTDLIRLNRWYVSKSGTYATATAGSHQGNLTIRVSGGGTTWSTIINTPFPIGQSQIGVYTIPSNKSAYLLSKNIFTDTSKTADVYFYQRTNADDVTTPYTGAMRLIEREVGIQGGYVVKTVAPKGPFVGPLDMGFMGKVTSGTAEVACEFELLLVDD